MKTKVIKFTLAEALKAMNEPIRRGKMSVQIKSAKKATRFCVRLVVK